MTSLKSEQVGQPRNGGRIEIKSGDERLPGLDGLRGIAILMVMTFHFLWFAEGFGAFQIGSSPLRRWIVALQYSGGVGVDLFFALSGFLITGILADHRGQPHYFRNFYVRRVLRIFPAYYLLLILWLLCSHLLPPIMASASEPHYQAWLWTYTSNLLLALQGWQSVPVPLHHLWSLAIEEQFYLCWPLIIFWLSPRKAIALSAILVIMSPLLRVALMRPSSPLGPEFLLMPARLDSLAAGGLMALLWRSTLNPDRLRHFVRMTMIVAFGLAAVLFVWRRGFDGEDPVIASFGLLVLGILFSSTVLLTATAGQPSQFMRLLASKPLRWLGKYSYGLYLWHQPVCLYLYTSGFMAIVLRAYALRAPWLYMVLLYAAPMLATALAAWLSWHLLEQPVLKLKAQFQSAPKQAL